MKTNQLIILAVCGLILVGIGVWYLSDSPPSLTALASTAVSTEEPTERKQVAADLTLVKDRALAVPQLQRLQEIHETTLKTPSPQGKSELGPEEDALAQESSLYCFSLLSGVLSCVREKVLL